MKEHRRSAVILIVTMAILHSFLGRVTAQDAIRKFDQALAQKLYSAIDQERANQGVKGVSAAVNIPNQGLWQGVSGLSGQAPPDTIAPDTRLSLIHI